MKTRNWLPVSDQIFEGGLEGIAEEAILAKEYFIMCNQFICFNVSCNKYQIWSLASKNDQKISADRGHPRNIKTRRWMFLTNHLDPEPARQVRSALVPAKPHRLKAGGSRAKAPLYVLAFFWYEKKSENVMIDFFHVGMSQRKVSSILILNW